MQESKSTIFKTTTWFPGSGCHGHCGVRVSALSPPVTGISAIRAITGNLNIPSRNLFDRFVFAMTSHVLLGTKGAIRLKRVNSGLREQVQKKRNIWRVLLSCSEHRGLLWMARLLSYNCNEQGDVS